MDATIRVLFAAVLVSAGFFSPVPALAVNPDPACQFTLNIPNLNVYPLQHRVRGDEKIEGKSRIEMEALIQKASGKNGKNGRNGKGLRLDLNLKIAEFKGDGTAFRGSQAFWLLDHWFVGGSAKIQSCLDNLYQACVKSFKASALSPAHLKTQCNRAAQWRITDSFKATVGDNNKNWTVYKKRKAKLVYSAECLTDTSGKLGCRNITFRPNIQINLNFGSKKLRQ